MLDWYGKLDRKLGELILDYNKFLLELDGLAAIFQGEDFGFNTQTLLPPDAIREYFLPWHKKYAQMIHEKGKVYYLHSCGEISSPSQVNSEGMLLLSSKSSLFNFIQNTSDLIDANLDKRFVKKPCKILHH